MTSVASDGGMMTYEATVPEGVYPGMKFAAILGGQHMVFLCPQNAGPGQKVRVQGPRPRETSAAARPSAPPPVPPRMSGRRASESGPYERGGRTRGRAWGRATVQKRASVSCAAARKTSQDPRGG